MTTFSGKAMGVDTSALAHFALGILWKGAIHNWKTVEGQTSRIDLGEFEDPIRRYPSGETDLPDGVFVVVAVCEDLTSRQIMLPPSKVNGSAQKMFSILVRGIWFHLITDAKTATEVNRLCCVRSEQHVLHLEDCSERLFPAIDHFKNAGVASNLAR
jgi:hypothetical protein